jgi:hypothetical protein
MLYILNSTSCMLETCRGYYSKQTERKYKLNNQLDATNCWFIFSTCFKHYYAHPHITNTIHTSPSNHYYIQTTLVDQISLLIFSRFGHQKAVLTNVLLRMGIIMLETCWENKPAFCWLFNLCTVTRTSNLKENSASYRSYYTDMNTIIWSQNTVRTWKIICKHHTSLYICMRFHSNLTVFQCKETKTTATFYMALKPSLIKVVVTPDSLVNCRILIQELNYLVSANKYTKDSWYINIPFFAKIH